MDSTIEIIEETWKQYSSGDRRFILGRKCVYDSAPGESRSEGNLPPRITVEISVSEIISGTPTYIGGIEVHVDRPRWKQIVDLKNEVEADDQLKEAAISARDRGNWDSGPVPIILDRGFEEIERRIIGGDSNISGKFDLSLDSSRLIPCGEE